MKVMLGTIPSDSHSWNLVYMQLLLNELECDVTQLGICTPEHVYVDTLNSAQFDLIVLSSINGHGFSQGKSVAHYISKNFKGEIPPMVIGGKLTTDNNFTAWHDSKMKQQGFSKVYYNEHAISDFIRDIESLFNAVSTR